MPREILLSISLVLILSGCLTDTPGEAPALRPLVSSSHPEATAAGLYILAAGGNAVDAAAAVQFALNVVEPMMSGIGGGAFLLIWDAEAERLVALDGRETAPAAATRDMYQKAMLDTDVPPQERGIAVGTPGTLAVWDQALRDHGTMGLAEIVAPAIRLADEGFIVDEVTSRYVAASAEKLRRSSAAAALLLPGAVCPPGQVQAVAVGSELAILPCDGGTAIAPGTRLVQPELAQALSLIARDGPPAFYQGPLGEALVAAVAQRGGILTMEDLAAYEVEEREPLMMEWRGMAVATLGHPSGGPTLLEALAIVEPLDVAPRTDPAAAHNAIEAMHLAFADRAAYHGDPATARATPEQLLDPAFIAQRRALIDRERTGAPFAAGTISVGGAAMQPAEPGMAVPPKDATEGSRGHGQGAAPPHGPAPGHDPARNSRVATSPGLAIAEGFHTTHFTVMDAAGNIVAATSTIESVFGSGIYVPEHGFFANNEMTDFDLVPGGPNEIGPGKRPRSSMSPTIVFDDAGALLGLGSPGGSTIPSSVFQVMLDVLAGATPLQPAVDAPRWASRLDATLAHEAGLDGVLRSALAAKGHDLQEVGVIGGVQALHRDPDAGWVAAADPRRAGSYGSL